MAMGRGSASSSAMVAVIVLVAILVHSEIMVEAATFTVGGPGGWSFNTASWPRGKRFRAGDVLVFKYNPTIHNVVAVNKNGYDTCKTPKGAQVFKSGNDQIKLAKGQNFFICNFVGHCESGMKIAVNAM